MEAFTIDAYPDVLAGTSETTNLPEPDHAASCVSSFTRDAKFRVRNLLDPATSGIVQFMAAVQVRLVVKQELQSHCEESPSVNA